ncbi:MAG: hypothetical protein KGZ39_03130 [Simkania sp.]|nr:hypothetical protein [Simkania sp.]
MKKGIFFLGLWLLTAACAPTSIEEYRKEGEAICYQFTEDLKKIHAREELVKAIPNIKHRYEEIVDLLIGVKEFEKEHFGEASDPWNTANFLASEMLMVEMKRIYLIEGGREIMERAQREALFRLDAALRKESIRH